MNQGHHHNDAVVHLAAMLLPRIVACWRDRTPYVIRDLDGTVITPEEGRAIVAEQHQVDPTVRRRNKAARAARTLKGRTTATPGTGRARKESPGAPAHRPAAANQTKNTDRSA